MLLLLLLSSWAEYVYIYDCEFQNCSLSSDQMSSQVLWFTVKINQYSLTASSVCHQSCVVFSFRTDLSLAVWLQWCKGLTWPPCWNERYGGQKGTLVHAYEASPATQTKQRSSCFNTHRGILCSECLHLFTPLSTLACSLGLNVLPWNVLGTIFAMRKLQKKKDVYATGSYCC